MIHPCPIAIPCLEGALENLSSEGPEPFWVPPIGTYWSAVGNCCDTTLRESFSTVSQDDADDTLARLLVSDCPDCPKPATFCASVTCPDGTGLTEICVPTSQADADALAALALAAMLPSCDSKTDLFTATCACPDGVTDLHTVYSNISQEVADAQCAAIPKVCPPVCSDPQTCTVACPEGGSFTYNLPACVVTAKTKEEANAIALALACKRAEEQRICLGNLPRCLCSNTAFTATLRITIGARPGLTWTIQSGSFPAGLTFHGGLVDSGLVTIDGSATIAGNYTFVVRVEDADGNFSVKAFELDVIEIATTSLPDFTIGTPYSKQLTVTGGSGNYAFSILSGSLPDGLTMSLTGLISGTPTGTATGGTIEFGVIDTTCDTTDRTFFPPRIRMSTASLTRVATTRGYDDFLNFRTKWKKMTVTGSGLQSITPFNAAFALGDNVPRDVYSYTRYEFAGVGEIDNAGNQITTYTKQAFFNAFQQFGGSGVETALGDYAANASFDNFQFHLETFAGGGVIDSTHKHNVGNGKVRWLVRSNSGSPVTVGDVVVLRVDGLFGYGIAETPLPSGTFTTVDTINGFDYFTTFHLPDTTSFTASIGTPDITELTVARLSDFPVGFDWSTFPDISFNNLLAKWAVFTGQWDYTVTLENEYTEADAIANATLIPGSGAAAQTLPRTSGFVSFYTSVVFTLQCVDLVVGENYRATVDFWRSDGTTVTQAYTFTATATTHNIVDSVPTPAAFQSIVVRNPKIAFV